MKAIILAAGYGNRMRPLTDSTHKTLIKVAGVSIIDRIINGLEESGILDICVVTGYRNEELGAYLLNRFPRISFEFVCNERYRETNNIYSLALAFDKISIDDDILLIESDIVYEPGVIKRLLASKHDNVALLDRYRSGMDGTVVNVSSGVITQVIPTHLQGESFDFSDKYKTLNIYKFSKDFCNNSFKKLLSYYAKVINDNCYYELILGILIYMQQEKIYAEIVENEKWAEIDDPNDLRVAEYIFNGENRLGILEDTFGGYWNHDVLDFCFISNMYFPTDSMISEIKTNLSRLVHNYGSKQEVLNMKLSHFLLLKHEFLNVLNGASQIYPLARRFFEGKKVLIPEPTFGEYKRVFTAADVYLDKVGIDKNEIVSKAKYADVVVIVNPNNPTGTLLAPDWILNLAEVNPQKIFFVDESFIEFSGVNSILLLLERTPRDNVIVLKSLSKSLGLPGLRLGFTYSSNQEFNDYIKKEVPIWNINSIAEFLLEIILKNRKALEQSYSNTVRDREIFASLLSKLKVVEKVYPSGANFILCSFKLSLKEGKDLIQAMLNENSVYLKDVSDKFNDGKFYLRFAVRKPHENESLLDLLDAYFYNGKL